MTKSPLGSAARITGLYVVLAGAWVLLSDRALAAITEDPKLLVQLERYNGWLFVAVTAALLYLERLSSGRNLRRLAAIVTSSHDAIIGKTLDGTITSWNQAAEALYGYSAKEAVGRSISMLIPRDRSHELEGLLQKVRRGEAVRHYKTVRLRKSGEEVHVCVSVSPIRGVAGRVIRASTTTHDFTDHRRAERATRMAEVGKLASGLVHEIRNPLNAMRMQVAVIRSKLAKPDDANIRVATEQLSRLENEVLRVRDLASGFLAFGRPPADKLEEVKLAELIRETAEFERPALTERHVGIDLDVAADTEKTTVVMDRGRLRQVLLNLFENARQAMPDGGVLAVRLTKPSATRVRITFRDSGHGIPEEKVARVFDAFYSTRTDGYGLGLAVVRQIVERADGQIHVTSEVNKGTSFEIELPTPSHARRPAAQWQPSTSVSEVSR